MDFRVDRELGVPIRQQLKGLIEYGIAGGELQVGETLPSVRELAARLGVAPMTVSQVYGELKDEGLVETRPGSGTLVADSARTRMSWHPGALSLFRRIDRLLDEGLAIGLSEAGLSSLIQARLFSRGSGGRHVRIAMVGLFAEATQRYADYIARHVGESATVEAMIIDEMRGDAFLKARAMGSDLVVTLFNRQHEVARLVPSANIVPIRFVPCKATRRALGGLAATARVLMVSTFADFMPVMRLGVSRLAGQVLHMDGVNIEDADLAARLAVADAVIYATGSERVLGQIGPDVPAFEYRHVPDPVDIETLIMPVVRAAADPQGSCQRSAAPADAP